MPFKIYASRPNELIADNVYQQVTQILKKTYYTLLIT